MFSLPPLPAFREDSSSHTVQPAKSNKAACKAVRSAHKEASKAASLTPKIFPSPITYLQLFSDLSHFLQRFFFVLQASIASSSSLIAVSPPRRVTTTYSRDAIDAWKTEKESQQQPTDRRVTTYSRKPTPDNFYPKITTTEENLASLLNQAT